jgi:hypothetical protein
VGTSRFNWDQAERQPERNHCNTTSMRERRRQYVRGSRITEQTLRPELRPEKA